MHSFSFGVMPPVPPYRYVPGWKNHVCPVTQRTKGILHLGLLCEEP